MYKAILHTYVEVHEVNAAGECTGNTLHPDELEDRGIKNKFLTDVSGTTKNDCLTKLKEVVNALRSNG